MGFNTEESEIARLSYRIGDFQVAFFEFASGSCERHVVFTSGRLKSVMIRSLAALACAVLAARGPRADLGQESGRLVAESVRASTYQSSYSSR